MKKTDKKKLALKTETIRELLPIELVQVVGGLIATRGDTGARAQSCIGCDSFTCPQ